MEIYFDNAATSHPKPDAVISAVHHALTSLNGNPGRASHNRAVAGSRLLMEARQIIAEFINAPRPECIIFCFNGTDALNTAIKGTLCVGDHVITSTLEHNSVLRVLEGLRRKGLISITYINPTPDGTIDPAHFEAALRPKTRLCILTHASNVTGVIQPVADIGKIMHQNGIYFLIDGAQAIGHIPIDVQALQCDLYAFPGHKGLLAPQGTGCLYIAPGRSLRAFREGGTGSSSDQVLQPAELPESLESGTVNLPGIAGLTAGVQLLRTDFQKLLETEKALSDYLWNTLHDISGIRLLTPLSERNKVGVLSFNVSDYHSSEVANYLNDCNIAVRSGLHCAPYTHRYLGTLERGAVRVSISWQNTTVEIDTLAEALRRII